VVSGSRERSDRTLLLPSVIRVHPVRLQVDTFHELEWVLKQLEDLYNDISQRTVEMEEKNVSPSPSGPSLYRWAHNYQYPTGGHITISIIIQVGT